MVKACVMADAMLTAVARGGAVEEWDPIKVCSFSLSYARLMRTMLLGVVEQISQCISVQPTRKCGCTPQVHATSIPHHSHQPWLLRKLHSCRGRDHLLYPSH
jgi:hypothetical protein